MKYVIVNAAGQPVGIVDNPIDTYSAGGFAEGDRIYQLGQELRIETKLVPAGKVTRSTDDMDGWR